MKIDRFFFFNDTATTEIYTLSLHDALPIFRYACSAVQSNMRDYRLLSLGVAMLALRSFAAGQSRDRESTTLKYHHQIISFSLFCLQKKIIRITLIVSSMHR